MQKIPVGQTIAFAYLFLFAHIGTVVGIAWLPAVLSAAVNYLTRLYAATHRAELDAGDPQTMGAYFTLSLAALLLMLFASSVVAAGITRQVQGQSFRGVVLYFAAGRTEFRMFAANLRYLAGAGTLFLLATLITFAAFMLAGIPLNSPEQIQPTAAAILAGLVSWAVFIYAFVTILRMGFLLPAVIVAEEKGGLRRSHDLTRGNIGRVFLIMLALGGPILLLLIGGETVVLRSALGPDFVNLSASEFFQRAGEAMEQKLLPWHIFSAVVFILGSGLIYSGSAYAYRTLVREGNEPRQPLA